MAKLEITIKDTETGDIETIDSESVLVLYLDGSCIKSRANISMKMLTPMITKAILEKMSR